MKMTQYGDLGCMFWHNLYDFKISHFLYKHNACIVSVKGRSIILYIECLGGMFLREILYKKRVAQFDES